MKHPTKRIMAALLSLILVFSVTGAAAYAEPVYTVDASDYNASAGTFNAVLYGVEDTKLVSSVKFPVWSKADQSDIVWYTAKLNSDGTYSATVSLSKHSFNVGTYNVHCYVYFTNGDTKLAGSDTIYVEGSSGSVSVYSYDGVWYASLDNHTLPGVSKVQFPVWSVTDDQDDIVWYTASKQSDGSYVAAIDLTKHKSLGEYAVHCYVTYTSGSRVFAGSSSFYAAAPSGGSVSLSPMDSTGGSYKAIVTGISDSAAIKSVKFPVWCSADQSDIIWYTASKESDGTYAAYIDFARHGYHAGTYQVHCYVTDICGTQYLAGGTSFTVSDNSGTVSVEPGDTAGTYVVKLSGAIYSGGIKSVRFPVWSSENGQDDIVWYIGTKQADGVYAATIKLSNHKNFGTYYAHCYITSSAGVMYMAGGTTFYVDQPTDGSLTVTSSGSNSGAFHICYTPSGNSNGISKVQFPVWCSSDQSDIKWYTATKETDGSFTCDVTYSNHKCHTGTYTIHAYVTDINGLRTCAAAANYDVTVSGKNIITATPVDSDSGKMIITIINASASGTISNLYFPTWSATNSQDDIVWYKATNIGGNTWQATVDIDNHSSSGVFYTHAYANGNEFLGSVSYSLKNTGSSKMNSKIAYKSSATNYLVAVDTSANTVGVYQGSSGSWNLVQSWSCTSGAASTPTPTGEFTIGSKGTSFSGTNYTCWYYTQFSGSYMFHSVLYQRGSQTNIRYGQLGAHMSDGCIRLSLENARWIYNNIPSGTKVVIY